LLPLLRPESCEPHILNPWQVHSPLLAAGLLIFRLKTLTTVMAGGNLFCDIIVFTVLICFFLK